MPEYVQRRRRLRRRRRFHRVSLFSKRQRSVTVLFNGGKKGSPFGKGHFSE